MAAEFVGVLFGFGAGLIAVGVLALVLPDVQDAVVILLLLSLPPEVWVVAKSRQHLSWRGLLAVLVGLGPGVLLGTAVLGSADASLLLALLGAFLLLAGGAFLLLPEGRSVCWPAWTAPVAGLLAGVLGGMFGTGGPPVILYYHLAGLPKSAFRGQLMAIFLVITLVRLPCYAVAGLLTQARLWSALWVLPGAFIGAYLGHRIHMQISERTFRRLVALLLCVMGLPLLGRALGAT